MIASWLPVLRLSVCWWLLYQIYVIVWIVQSWCPWPSSLIPSGPPMMAEFEASIDLSLTVCAFWWWCGCCCCCCCWACWWWWCCACCWWCCWFITCWWSTTGGPWTPVQWKSRTKHVIEISLRDIWSANSIVGLITYCVYLNSFISLQFFTFAIISLTNR